MNKPTEVKVKTISIVNKVWDDKYLWSQVDMNGLVLLIEKIHTAAIESKYPNNVGPNAIRMMADTNRLKKVRGQMLDSGLKFSAANPSATKIMVALTAIKSTLSPEEIFNLQNFFNNPTGEETLNDFLAFVPHYFTRIAIQALEC